MSRENLYRHREKVFDVSLPVDGPLSSEEFFAERPPVVGLPPCRRMAVGCAGIGLGRDRHDGKKGIEMLHSAWRAGFRLTDTARAYGDGERILGSAARSWSGDPSIIATKFGGPTSPPRRSRHSGPRAGDCLIRPGSVSCLCDVKCRHGHETRKLEIG